MGQPRPVPAKSVDPIPQPGPGLAQPALVDSVLTWYAHAARDLPWRRPGTTPWAVMISEFMLQQTPVTRVIPVYETWLRRWPTPADLAAESPGEAVRAWGRLGYPRRALRLHAAAGAIVAEHDGRVPDDIEALRRLPGVGSYTAAAIGSFSFGQRHAVLDTNVRRVLGRVVRGAALPPPSTTVAETRLAEGLAPTEPARAARWAVAVMELGALVCTARSPRCDACPVRSLCCWDAAGRPAHDGPRRRTQPWAGTDRQVRGLLLAVLRGSAAAVPLTELDATWPDPVQRGRALDGLVADGLVELVPPSHIRLPT